MGSKEDNPMICSEFDALLSQAIDGTLSSDRAPAFEAHGRECQLCGPLLQEAQLGRSWLKSLTEVEPPPELLATILLRTTGLAATQDQIARAASAGSRLNRLRDWTAGIVSPVIAVARQPRFAMSFGMAFFTVSVMLSLAGVKLNDLRHIDLRPSAVRRTYYETTGRVVKYYENIRFVYEIESRVRQLQESTAPAERPPEPHDNGDGKDKTKKDTSGQPEQKQERNYSQGGNAPFYAFLNRELPQRSMSACGRLA
jgi:hypothetical protein